MVVTVGCALVSIDAGKATTTQSCLSKNVVRSLSTQVLGFTKGMGLSVKTLVRNDLTVNITRAKQMTNVRSATKDQTAVIKTPRILTLLKSLLSS